MSRSRKYSDEFCARVRELWAAGQSASAIAGMLGVTKGVISGLGDRMKLPSRLLQMPVRRITPEQSAEALRLLQAGIYRAEIARLLDVAPSAVNHLAWRHGLMENRSGRARQAAPPARPPALPRPAAPMSVRSCRIPPGGQCLYPVGEHDPTRWIDGTRCTYLACTAPIAAGSYCVEHAAICYLPPKRRGVALLMDGRAAS